MMSGPDDGEDLDVLAGEFVLGTLEDAEREAFALRLTHDAAARSAVAAVRERFLELDLTAGEGQAPAALWQRIDEHLTRAPSDVVELAAHRQRPRTMAAPKSGRLRSDFWKGFAAASLLTVLAVGLASSFMRTEQPRLIVVLLDAEAKPVSIVEAFDGRQVRVVPLGRIEVPAGKALQVWTLPDQGTGPVSIGLLPSVQAITLHGPALPTPKVDQLYEITLEPSGGSPTGRPTGPVIGKGYARMPQI